MVYIYDFNGELKVTRDDRPTVEKVIELERMIPMPVKRG